MAAKTEIVFRGNGVSPGVVLGQALKIDSHNRLILRVHVDDVEAEAQRYLRAVENSKEQLRTLKYRLEEKVGREHSVILDAHLLMLEDRSFNSEVLSSIRNDSANAEWAVTRATDRLVVAYKSLDDEYFRERHSDIEYVAERILLNLSGDHPLSWDYLSQDLIIASHDFNPSNFATMDLTKVRGLVLESGGRNSHTAIISRGLRLPAVMGLQDFLESVATGDSLLLDGDAGLVIVNPSPERIDAMRGRLDAFSAISESSSSAHGGRTTMTKDGAPVSLRANTELLHELETAKSCGAEGIGLFRSEFLYFGHPRGLPSMEEQLAAYGRLASEMSPYKVAIRTLDAGSEKISHMSTRDSFEGEDNPSMGLRGIRLSLHAQATFRTQIEAVLRASVEGTIEIVLPMVSTVEEVWQAKAIIQEEGAKLKRAGLQLPPVPLGVMIEVPAAVLSLETLAREVDFLCVGTNDLIQYMLAVDRGNPHVAYLYQPLHPSVLQCLHRVAAVAAKLEKPVRICGEISSNPFFAVLLLGMGFNQLSMNPLSIPTIRRVLREVPLDLSKRIARRALKLPTAYEVHRYITASIAELISWDLTSFANEIAAPNGLSRT